MDPATRINTNHSTKSYLERELIVSLDNDGPMIGPTLEMMDTHHEGDEDYTEEEEEEETASTSEKQQQQADQQQNEKKKWWKKLFNKKEKDYSDPRKFPTIKKNTILFLVAIGGAM